MENNNPVIAEYKKPIGHTFIFSGNYELIDSKSILLFDNENPLEIEEVFNDQFKVMLRIIMVDDETKKYSIQYNVDVTKNIVEYKCFNFNNSLGTGTRKPIEVGNLEGKKFYIHFWIYALGDDEAKVKRIEYSIWRER